MQNCRSNQVTKQRKINPDFASAAARVVSLNRAEIGAPMSPVVRKSDNKSGSVSKFHTFKVQQAVQLNLDASLFAMALSEHQIKQEEASKTAK